MVTQVIKRDGRKVKFNKRNIENVILRAWSNVTETSTQGAKEVASKIADEIEGYNKDILTVEEIHDMVEKKLMASSHKEVAASYVKYRYRKQLAQNTNSIYQGVLKLVNFSNEELKEENSNKNAVIASTQRDYMAGEVSKDVTKKILLPEELAKAHEEGIIHFHDMDYFVQKIPNCCLVNLEDMLQNGTVINGTLIQTPHSFATACNIATQIIACVASGQYGGQSVTLSHLAPFVNVSRLKIRKELQNETNITKRDLSERELSEITELRLKDEIKKGIQTIQYQINTLNTSNGQTPFVTVFMYLGEVEDENTKADLALIIEEVLRQRIKGVQNEKGAWIAPAFPKLIYCLEEDNITENSKYWYLTKLAAECSAKRLVPDYISEKKMKELKGDVYPCMGCRSFLTPDRFTDTGIDNIANARNYIHGMHKYYGRFNQGVVTLNLVDAACSSKTTDEFWDILDKRLELCHEALRIRHNRLKGTISDISPIHWQYGALARLEKNEPIDKLLYNGYSTISLGYAGLWECVYKLIGKKLTEPDGEALGLQIMQKLNDACNKWKQNENIDYSLYGTPLESSTYRFAKCLKRRFGVIPGVTDKNYITNSYHIHVTENIDAFSKLKIESKFQALSPGGLEYTYLKSHPKSCEPYYSWVSVSNNRLTGNAI